MTKLNVLVTMEIHRTPFPLPLYVASDDKQDDFAVQIAYFLALTDLIDFWR